MTLVTSCLATTLLHLAGRSPYSASFIYIVFFIFLSLSFLYLNIWSSSSCWQVPIFRLSCHIVLFTLIKYLLCHILYILAGKCHTFCPFGPFFLSLPLAGDIKDTNKIKGPRKINIEIIYQKSFNKEYMSETLNNYPKHKKNLRHVTYGIQYFCSILQYFFTHYFADNIRDPGWQWFWICSSGRLSHLYLPGEQNIVIIIILIMTIININTGPWLAFDISHHCHHQQWCDFFSSRRTFQHGECEILSYFCTKLRTFWHTLDRPTEILVFILSSPCNNIEKYV